MRSTVAAPLGTLALLQASPALAQAYPERSVKIVVPFAPGALVMEQLQQVFATKLTHVPYKVFAPANSLPQIH